MITNQAGVDKPGELKLLGSKGACKFLPCWKLFGRHCGDVGYVAESRSEDCGSGDRELVT